MSDIGFQMESEADFEKLAARAYQEGEICFQETGSYIKWAPGEGVELWVQLDRENDIIGMNPHFRGQSRLRVGLTHPILPAEGTALDGAFHGWANPETEDPESGDFPFVFEVPDFQLHQVLCPAIMDVQLAAFADELQSYESDEAYYESQTSEMKFASESFIPSGLFTPGEGTNQHPTAHAIFSGHVLETSLITNPATGNDFCWARVRALGGEVDMIADPALLNGLLVQGGVVSGSFWLSGSLVQ